MRVLLSSSVASQFSVSSLTNWLAISLVPSITFSSTCEFNSRWTEDNAKLDDTFTNWGEGQPNGGDLENCLAIDDDDGTWHDYPCGEQKYYVCSKPNSKDDTEGCKELGSKELCSQSSPLFLRSWTELSSHFPQISILKNGRDSFQLFVGVFDTCLVWYLLVLPSEIYAVAYMTSMRPIDGNTSYHSCESF